MIMSTALLLCLVGASSDASNPRTVLVWMTTAGVDDWLIDKRINWLIEHGPSQPQPSITTASPTTHHLELSASGVPSLVELPFAPSTVFNIGGVSAACSRVTRVSTCLRDG